MHFIDLQTQLKRIKPQIDTALERVFSHGQYIMGPEVTELEAKLAEYSGVKHVVSCASGTDALILGLLSLNIGEGDAVFVPSFTFAATAEVVVLLGATPIFVDVNEKTFLMDIEHLEESIDYVEKETSLTPKGIIGVDLFGQAMPQEELAQVASEHAMWIINDAAQSFGATRNGRQVVEHGICSTVSFFPAKPLGCYGDGGAVFTNDDVFADKVRSCRVHGAGKDRYSYVRIGITGRLDSMQAAVLLEKLKIFDDEIEKRNCVARLYEEGLKGFVATPLVLEGNTSVWAQYVVQTDSREKLMEGLKSVGIPSMVHYPVPLHKQPIYELRGIAVGSLSASEKVSERVVSLPMHPYLDKENQLRVIEKIQDIFSI